MINGSGHCNIGCIDLLVIISNNTLFVLTSNMCVYIYIYSSLYIDGCRSLITVIVQFNK